MTFYGATISLLIIGLTGYHTYDMYLLFTVDWEIQPWLVLFFFVPAVFSWLGMCLNMAAMFAIRLVEQIGLTED